MARFLDNSSIEQIKEMVIQVINFLLRNPVRYFCSLARKRGLNGTAVVYGLHKWLISIFSKTIESSNPQIYTDVFLEGPCILTANDGISNFRLVANRIKLFILGSCSGRDFLITANLILKMFEVSKRVIQVLHFLFCIPLDIFVP